MNIMELLQLLKRNNISVSSERGALKTVAPKGAITAEIADLIRGHKIELIEFLERAAAPATRIGKAAPASAWPLSFAQQRLWFIDRLSGDSRQYNMPMALRLIGDLDEAALQRSLDTLLDRHQSLRTCFLEIDDVPMQVLAPDAALTLDRVDLAGLPADAQAPELARRVREEAARPFDLARDLMLRCCLIRLAEREHALLFTMHHIASDAWSIAVLVREVSALYGAFVQGKANPLPPLEIQYADYASWQRGWLQGETLQQQIRYWREQLDGAPTLVEFPSDRPRPALRSHAGGQVQIRLSRELSASLRALSMRHGATLFMTLLAGWSALIARLCRQDEIIVGSPVANRHRPEVEPLIGFFVNTLALRVRMGDDPTVASLLEQIRQTTLDSYAHQDLPFEQVVEALQPVRSLSHSPLFQTVLSVNNTPAQGELSLPGLQLAPVDMPHTTTHFDLSLNLADGGDQICGGLEYASDLFDESTVAQIASRLQRVLEAMVADERCHVSALPLLDGEERSQLLDTFNATDVAYPAQSTIHAEFERRVAQSPDAIALTSADQSLSYAELNTRANRIAHRLIALGVKPDDRVALVHARSIDLLVATLGVLKAGAAYVPLDPAQPAERLIELIEDAAPVALLGGSDSDAVLVQHLGARGLEALNIADLSIDAALPSTNPAVSGLGPRNLAYVMYTSGSTGRPKGVMVEHRSVLRLVINNHYAPIDATDCVAHCANPAFDASTWEVWSALLNGARVLVVPPSVVLDPPALCKALVEGGVSALWLTVGLFNEYVDLLGPAFAKLKHLLVGGDALDPRTIARLLRSPNRPQHLVNGYGPTETTTFAITHAIESVSEHARSIPIGKPIANTRIHILDGNGQLVPVGVKGEIHIGGPGVARGYLNQPELTAERFIADPYSNEHGARLYRTGDLGRWLADGSIEYLGRNDFQVKIRGFRIELGEIEARLAACEGVRESVVLAHSDARGDKRLLAWVVAEPGAELVIDTLRRQLSAVLPDYMVPAAIVPVDALPLTANGKLDRKALPMPGEDDRFEGEYVAPQGATELALAAIWSRVLGTERISRDANFFALGGHSLMATRVVSEIARTLGKPVSVRALFEHPQLSQLAAHIDGQQAQDYRAIPIADRSQPLPLSFAQQRLWFLDQLDHAAGAAYHMPAALRLSGALDRDALKATLDRIVARHENLRTHFASVEGSPVQVIAPESSGFSLIEQDLGGLDASAQDEAVASIAALEARAPFDLSTGPLIRGRLLRLSGDEHVLLVTQHHIISDGWSIGVLVKEVSTLYAAFAEGRPDPMPALPIQYADYAAWQRGHVKLQEQIEYWRTQLKGAPALLELPTDRPRPAVQSYAGGSHSFRMPASLAAQLHALSARHGTTLFMTLLAGWSALLSRLSGQGDVVVGSPVANRQRSEVEPLIGFFVNTLPLRVQFDADPDVASLLAAVKRITLGAYANQDAPFEHVVEVLQPARSLAHSPIFQAVLALNNTPDGGVLEVPGLLLSSVEQPHTTTQFDLSLNLSENVHGISALIEYASDLFDESTVAQIASRLQRVLEAMVADDQCRVSALPLLDEDERGQLLDTFNATDVAYPAQSTIHAEFERRVAQSPDAIALTSADQSLSYAELNTRANRIAHRLIALGVKPDDRVALVHARSIDLLVATLGVLKAGAAYVPLDPAQPAERLIELIEDAAPVALLGGSETDAVLAQHLGARGLEALNIADLSIDAALPSTNPAVSGLGPRNLAYVMYTSGSTGRPKGVMVEHRSVLRLVINNHYAPVDATDCVAHCANPAFDASTWEVWSALLNGARVLVVPPSVVLDPPALCKALVEGGVSALWLTVGLFNEYVDLLGPAFAKLKYLLVGGDALDPRTIARLLRSPNRPQHLVNGYGPTETTTFAITHAIESVSEHARSIPIGKSIANTRIHILDGNGQLVPVGVKGEIHIGGPGVARGYLNQPELTAERFIADPYSNEHGARLYRTGDLGRWLADGSIEYLGRNDFQVKIRGFRIELGEIESSIAALEGVREVVVLAREDATGRKRIVAWVVPGDGDVAPSNRIEQLRDHLRTRLPDYMQPSAWVLLDQLPLTGNGKVDRARLPEPSFEALQQYVAPQGEVETRLCEIWQQVLRLDRVGVQDNFFEIGGDSILSIQVVSRANQAGIGISTKQLFEAQTISQLARLASQGNRVQAPQGEVEGGLSLLPIQHAFFMDDPCDRHHFNQSVLLETPAGFDAEVLGAVIEAIWRRHDALRLRFVERDGQWHAEHVPFDAQMLAASCIIETLPADVQTRAAFIGERCNHWQASFELERGPLLRAVHFVDPDGGDGGRLLLTVHHAVVDGVSWRVLLGDLEQAYVQHRSGQPIVLAAKTSSFQQWGEALAEHAATEALQREKALWLAQCAQRVAPLPVDHAQAGPGSIADARSATMHLDAELTRALQQQCASAYRTQINELLLAGVYLGMRAWTGESGLRLRLEGHGRESLFDHLDVTQTVGWFTTVYPLTLRSGTAAVDEVIKSVKEQVRAIPNHGIGYGLLRYLCCDPELTAAAEAEGGEPQLEFNYLGQFDQVVNAQSLFQVAAEPGGAQGSARRQRSCQLSLSGMIHGGELQLSLSYNGAQYEAGTMQRLIALIEDGLRQVIAHCRQPGVGAYTPSDFPLARIDQGRLDALQTRFAKLSRLYPATPMQTGLHFHSLLDRSAYVVQVFPVLRGALDASAFRAAWNEVVARHDILRTAFVGEGEGLHQLVLSSADLPWHEEDWRGLDAQEQEERFARWREQDKQAGFDFEQPSLMRIALFRLDEERWQLLWTQHHILLDGWCMPLVYRDAMLFYQAQLSGRPARLPEPPPYERYIGWLESRGVDEARGWWKELLGGFDAPTPLVVDRLPGDGGFGYREQYLSMSEAETASLQALAKSLHTTVNTLLQWSWGYLLHRYSGENEVVFGATISGRAGEVPGIEEMVGLFINTIPVKVGFADGRSVAESLTALHQSFQRSNEYGYLSLVEIQRQSGVRTGTALFDSIMAFENYPLDAMEAVDNSDPRNRLEIDKPGNDEQTNYTLSLSANVDRTLNVRFGFRAEQFAQDTIDRLISHLSAILRQLPAVAEVSAIELIDAREQAELDQWNQTTVARPDCGVHTLFEAQVRSAPDALALAFGQQTLSYAQLDARANEVAQALLGLGVRPDTLVGLCLPRSLDMLIGVLGILKAGAAYLPLDPEYPRERLQHMIADSGINVVVSHEELQSSLDLFGDCRVLALDAPFPTQSVALPRPDVRASSLAYAIYTSGSTGVPKGVLLDHRGMVNLALAQKTLYGVDAYSRVLAFASLSFDAAAWEWLMALANGASLHICSESQRHSTAELADWLVSQRITHATLPPALLAHVDIELDYALEVLIVAGEACDEKLAWNWSTRCRVCNAYGPSENTVAASSADVRAGEIITLGHALPNVELRVLDARQRELPVGIVGELCLGGHGLARGYLNRPELTQQAFIEHPRRAGERLYRTGDLVRRLPDGQLLFLGRSDDQVKIRGFRVELGEVEARLSEHPALRDASVIAHRDGARTRLVAYAVPNGNALSGIDQAELIRQLRDHLRTRLPDYMQPSAWVLLDQLPLTGNGKVDRARLPEPSFEALQQYVAPQGEVETRLCEIWQQVLRLDRVGVQDNFFEIGGDSILSIQVVSRANQAGIGISTKQLFEAQTISQLARLASQGNRVQAPQGEVEGGLSLLPIQHAFFMDDPCDRHHFNQSVLLETPAGFDAEVLGAVIEAIWRRHDALRLRFVERDGQWHAEHVPFDAQMLAASCIIETLPADVQTRAAFIGERCNHWQASFELERGPLLRAVHFVDPDGGDGGRLLLTVHHAVVDGVSWRVLLGDLEQAYVQHRSGQPIVLAAKTSSFQQWGEALAEHAATEALQREKALWLAQCAQRVAPLPVDHAQAGPGSIADARSATMHLDAELTRALQQQCASAYRTQINELLLAGVYLGMRAWTGESGLRLRLEGHGRESLFDHLDVTQTVGWFTTVYPLTLRSGTAAVDEVIKSVKEQVRAIPNHGIGYGLLRYLCCDPELTAAAEAEGGEPQLEFNYLGQFDQVVNAQSLFQVAAEPGGAQGSARRQRSCQLSLSGMIHGGELQLSLSYNGAQYEAGTMQRLIALIEDGLRQVIAHCRQPGVGAYTPSDFPLARIDQGRLDALQTRFAKLSRLYPATPMQTGLHFHSLLDRSAYVVQVFPVLRGALDASAFRAAWNEVVARHDILRTAFVGEGEGLHQLVLSSADLPWHEEDWRGLDAQEQEERFARWREQDKQAGFDFEQPSLMRIALFRLDEERWQLLWTQHHILLDGWCMPLVYRDAMLFYQAQLSGRPARLPEPPPYERYIGWLESRGVDEARGWWKELLGGFDAPTPLVVDRLPGDGGFGYREQYLSMSEAETASLQALAKSLHTTVNTLLQWSWGYLLHRYSGENEVVFGATISGRAGEVPGIEEMVGLFINTIPVKVGFADGRSVAESLTALHQSFQRSNEYGYLSLVEIQRQSGVRTGTALFDSIMAFENYPLDAMEAVDNSDPRNRLEIETSGNDEQTNYSLCLTATLERVLEIKCGYHGEDYAEATIQRLLGHLRRILNQLPAAVAADQRVELLDADERRGLLDWSAIDHSCARDALVHRRFESQVARDPSAIALVWEGQTLSYGELNARANRLAHRLIALGVRPDDRVAICVERGLDMVVGILGILKSGAAYVPLDPVHPVERLGWMIEDSAPVVLLSQASLAERLQPLLPQGLPLQLFEDASLADASDQDPVVAGLNDAHLAYVIYTSGSTGLPKGVMVEHGHVARLFTATEPLFGFDEKDVWTLFHSFAFDFSVWELWGALCYGGRLVLVSSLCARTPSEFWELVSREGVTVLNQTPTAFRALIAAQAQSTSPHMLRYVIFGGEALELHTLSPWIARNDAERTQLINMYGITEITVHATYRRITSEDVAQSRGSLIGRALPDLALYVLDAQREPVPVGVTGELYVGGGGVARGYLNRAELSAERFLANPFDSKPGSRLYKTGDLGRWLPDGTLEYLGRNDFQVKIRGFRIELGEIEARLSNCAGVREAVVIAREDVAGDKRLVAYLVAGEGEALSVSELRETLSRELAEYMVPSAFVMLEELPLTANGKLDRKALPAPDQSAVASRAYAAPEGETEQAIAAIWQTLLGLERVGRHDHFFELGGHSLLAVRMLGELRSHFGLEISIRDAFERTSVSALAGFIDERLQMGSLRAELALDLTDNNDQELVEL